MSTSRSAVMDRKAERELALLEAEIERRKAPLRLEESIPERLHPILKPFRYKGLYGGRGGTKSQTFGRLLLSRAHRRKGLRAVCVREFQKSLEQSVKRLLDDLILEYDLTSHGFRSYDTRIDTPGEGIIIFQGMQNHTADSIKSLEGYDIAWVEEAQTLSQRSLDLLRPTIREEDSELWFSWNPRHATDPVDALLRGSKPPEACVIEISYQDNPHFPEVLRKEMEWDRSRDPEKYQHVWLGGYERHSEARVFKNWKIEEFDTPLDVIKRFGGDWGYSVDPSVLVSCFVIGRKLYIDHEAYRVGVEVDFLPDLFDQVPGARVWPITADSARPETISYLQRHGFPKIKPSIKGKDSVKEGVIFLQNYDIIVHPRCVHTIDELTMYSFKIDSLTNTVTPILSDKKNHVIDSLRYAVEDLRRGFDYREAGMTSSVTW